MCVIDHLKPSELAELLTLEYSADAPWICPKCQQDIIDTTEQFNLKAYFVGHARAGGQVFDKFTLETPVDCASCGFPITETAYFCHSEGTGLAENLFNQVKGE